MKHFCVMDMKHHLEITQKFCETSFEIMKFAYSTDPHKSLGKYNPICWCDGCKQISKVITKNAGRTHFSKEPKENIIDDVNAILFNDRRREYHARSSDEDSD